MLEQNKTELANASQAQRRAAELIAHEFLTTELEQNLIPRDEAVRTVDTRREQNDETWMRAVYASLKGLHSAQAGGYMLEASS